MKTRSFRSENKAKKIRLYAERTLCALLLVLVCILTVPIFQAAAYARPAADDYSFSYLTFQALQAGKGVFGVLAAVAKEVAEIYRSWQGTYAAIFLFALQPGIAGIYPLTTVILVLLPAVCLFFFYTTLLRVCTDSGKGEVRTALALTLAGLILMLEVLPDVREGLFWWNGAIYYTGFFSLALLFLSLMLRLIITRHKISCGIACCILALVIGGGNYTTALVTSEILILAAAMMLVFLPKEDVRRKRITMVILATVLLLLGFAISVLAPGNAVRQSSTAGLPAGQAVKEAFVLGTKFLISCLGFPMVLYVLFCILVFFLFPIRIPKAQQPVRTLLGGLVLLYLLYISGFVPALYGIGNIGAGRQQNIYFDTILVLVPVVIGLLRSCGGALPVSHEKVCRGILVLCGALFLLTAVLLVVRYDFSSTTTGKAVESLKDGELKAYAEEYDAITRKILTTKDDTVIIPDISHTPDLYPWLGIEKGTDGWVNQAMARYYGKTAIDVK